MGRSKSEKGEFGEAGKPAMVSILVRVEPRRIALFKAFIESYDNLATMRTEDPARHHLRLWFDPATTGDIECALNAVAKEFGLERLG
jgi:hypothetical protein